MTFATGFLLGFLFCAFGIVCAGFIAMIYLAPRINL